MKKKSMSKERVPQKSVKQYPQASFGKKAANVPVMEQNKKETINLKNDLKGTEQI